MAKPLIVGEQPSKSGDYTKPLEGRIGQRMANWAGITFEQYLGLFDRVNLLHMRIEYTGKGTDFNVREAGKVAKGLAARLKPGQKVIICGKRAAAAFGIVKVDYFEWFALNHAKAVIVPHPSSANRYFNDIDNERRMIDFMRSLASSERV